MLRDHLTNDASLPPGCYRNLAGEIVLDGDAPVPSADPKVEPPSSVTLPAAVALCPEHPSLVFRADASQCPDCGSALVVYDRRLPAGPGREQDVRLASHAEKPYADLTRDDLDKLSASTLEQIAADTTAPSSLRELAREAQTPRPSVTQEQVERAALVLAGEPPCWCPDDWREAVDETYCPQHGGEKMRATTRDNWLNSYRRRVRKVLAALGSPVEDEAGERGD